ncbi:recombinase RecT [Aquipseudomonas alcaligenes]|uniref:recombinase RecT n=1 Tax=Aquipseudomonas alcaligenes TaxID=43263 RepID=UPI00365B40D9
MSQANLAIVEKDVYGCRDAFAQVLADPAINFEREAVFAMQVLSRNDYTLKVAANNRQSVADAITNVASIGISLNPARKQAYLVPRDGKICLDISYMGLMDLAMATGSILWAKADLVHEADQFELNGFDRPPTHGFKPFAKDRGAIVGVYVVVKTADGDYLTEAMSLDDVYAIRDRSSAWKAWIKDKKSCPWVTDEGEMIKKTCVKRAYKYWPKTDRLERAIHYLNTDGGQGIDLHNQQAHAADPSEADAWIAKAQSAVTEAELTAIWTEGVAALRKTRDMAGYERLKAAVAAHGEVLKLEPLEGEVA